MLARDSIVYFIIIFGPCVRGLLTLTSTVHHFLACLIMDILGNIDDNITIEVTT
jgi:hypothetical protein